MTSQTPTPREGWHPLRATELPELGIVTIVTAGWCVRRRYHIRVSTSPTMHVSVLPRCVCGLRALLPGKASSDKWLEDVGAVFADLSAPSYVFTGASRNVYHYFGRWPT